MISQVPPPPAYLPELTLFPPSLPSLLQAAVDSAGTATSHIGLQGAACTTVTTASGCSGLKSRLQAMQALSLPLLQSTPGCTTPGKAAAVSPTRCHCHGPHQPPLPSQASLGSAVAGLTGICHYSSCDRIQAVVGFRPWQVPVLLTAAAYIGTIIAGKPGTLAKAPMMEATTDKVEAGQWEWGGDRDGGVG